MTKAKASAVIAVPLTSTSYLSGHGLSSRHSNYRSPTGPVKPFFEKSAKGARVIPRRTFGSTGDVHAVQGHGGGGGNRTRVR